MKPQGNNVLLFLIQGLLVSAASENSPLVNLGDSTSIRGFVTHTYDSSKPVYTFTGVPYAEKPVRFQPAETLRLWDGERDATTQGNICVQNPESWKPFDPKFELSEVATLSEDCLLLSIWTPTLDVNSKLDVMVWIHGGGFIMGTGAGYEGTAFSTFHDVVFVSINYRLAGLGFLTTGDSHAPGNVGLLDQVEALRWIRKYIHRFGGDSHKVTIFGESAGGYSVSYHLVSPLSQNLFNRAISESGVSLLEASHTREKSPFGISKTRELAEREGCPSKDTKSMIECLQTKPPETFVKEEDYFVPLVDGHFLPDTPYNLYTTGQFHAKDYLLGFNSHEGHILLELGLPIIGDWLGKDIEMSHFTKESAKSSMEVLASLEYGENCSQIIDRLMQEYIGDKETHEDLHRGLTELYGDLLMNSRILDAARKHSVKKDTFVYIYKHRLGPVPHARPSWVIADHGDEELIVLGTPFFKPLFKQPLFEGRDNYTNEDRFVSKLLMSYWANFAKTGDPNGEGLSRWPKYDCKTKRYLVLGTNPQEEADFEPDRMKMWMEEIPTMDNSKTYKGFPWKCPMSKKEEL